MNNETFHVFKLVVSYDGTHFKGWQRGNGRTVQGVLEDALLASMPVASKGSVPRGLDAEALTVVGAGRTDAGVHALGQVASVRVPSSVDPELLFVELNRKLPEDISVRSLQWVDDRFHARYRALAKTYRYTILDGRVGDPFLGRFAWRVDGELDEAAMKRASESLIGKRDFTSLTADKSKKDKTRILHSIEISRKASKIEIDFRGDSFLWNQVRIMAALLVASGKHKIDAEGIGKHLAAHSRSFAPAPAPARGLCLLSVEYDDE
ncbi:tRNA pseudouridine(38-40) synthase TruA [Treponema sp.]